MQTNEKKIFHAFSLSKIIFELVFMHINLKRNSLSMCKKKRIYRRGRNNIKCKNKMKPSRKFASSGVRSFNFGIIRLSFDNCA